jgi:hypothetical protein
VNPAEAMVAMPVDTAVPADGTTGAPTEGERTRRSRRGGRRRRGRGREESAGTELAADIAEASSESTPPAGQQESLFAEPSSVPEVEAIELPVQSDPDQPLVSWSAPVTQRVSLALNDEPEQHAAGSPIASEPAMPVTEAAVESNGAVEQWPADSPFREGGR